MQQAAARATAMMLRMPPCRSACPSTTAAPTVSAARASASNAAERQDDPHLGILQPQAQAAGQLQGHADRQRCAAFAPVRQAGVSCSHC